MACVAATMASCRQNQIKDWMIKGGSVLPTGKAALSSGRWTSKAATHTSWLGGTWMATGSLVTAGPAPGGRRNVGAGDLDDRTVGRHHRLDDPAWAGRTWSGRTWSAGTWSGRTWSGNEWSTATLVLTLRLITSNRTQDGISTPGLVR